MRYLYFLFEAVFNEDEIGVVLMEREGNKYE